MSVDQKIFIFSLLGRSGSTLLQRFFCSHPDIIVWGEGHGLLSRLIEATSAMDKIPCSRLASENALNYQTNINHIQPNVSRDGWIKTALQCYYETGAVKLGRSMWGAKFVIEPFENAGIIKRIFPEAVIIAVFRNPFDQCASTMYRYPQFDKPLWRFNTNYTRFIKSYLDNCNEIPHFLIRYEDLIERRIDALKPIIDDLNLSPYDFDKSVFDVVVGSANPKPLNRDQEDTIGPTCIPLYKQLLIYWEAFN